LPIEINFDLNAANTNLLLGKTVKFLYHIQTVLSNLNFILKERFETS